MAWQAGGVSGPVGPPQRRLVGRGQDHLGPAGVTHERALGVWVGFEKACEDGVRYLGGSFAGREAEVRSDDGVSDGACDLHGHRLRLHRAIRQVPCHRHVRLARKRFSHRPMAGDLDFQRLRSRFIDVSRPLPDLPEPQIGQPVSLGALPLVRLAHETAGAGGFGTVALVVHVDLPARSDEKPLLDRAYAPLKIAQATLVRVRTVDSVQQKLA